MTALPEIETGRRKSTVAVIGAGFSGLAAAAILARQEHNVVVFEKNDAVGGRARRLASNGFVFDMGPSWYWMPDVFENYYNIFGHTTSDFYELKKLDPGFKMIFGKDDCLDIPADFDQLCELFESIETGSATKLKGFMQEAEVKYRIGMGEMVFQPCHSVFEFFKFGLIKDSFKLQLFSSFSKHVRKHFKNERLIALIEFPVLFLGAMPKDTPALYSLMNYAGLKQGTFYPMGGFGKVVDAFETIARSAGVNFRTSENVEKLQLEDGNVVQVKTSSGEFKVDGVVAAADYHHVEQALIPKQYRTYDENYWEKRILAPSCLLFYIGAERKIDRLSHHNLFFDADIDQHSKEIYEDKKWPSNPLFYVCCPSKTDSSVAPNGCENLFVLMPIASGLAETEGDRDVYFNILMDRMEEYSGHEIRKHIIYKKSYASSDFVRDYNAYKGNAYGLANTLFQTAIFKPKVKSKNVKNLFFSGQLTVPGPGVPPSIISGQIAARSLLNFFKSR